MGKLMVGLVKILAVCAALIALPIMMFFNIAFGAAEIHHPESNDGSCSLTHPDNSLDAPDQAYATGTGGFSCAFTLFPAWQVPSDMNVSDVSVFLYLDTAGNSGTYKLFMENLAHPGVLCYPTNSIDGDFSPTNGLNILHFDNTGCNIPPYIDNDMFIGGDRSTGYSDIRLYLQSYTGNINIDAVGVQPGFGDSSSQSPDLSPTAILFNSSDLVAGRTVFFDSGVQNLGSQGTGVFNVRWFVDGVSMGYGSHAGVPANTTILDGNSQFSWVATVGTHTIEFAVDVDDHVEESDESNNSRSVAVMVIEAKNPYLIVLVHGCCTDKKDVKEWKDMGKEIKKKIQNKKDWEIMVWDWHKDTPLGITRINDAYRNAVRQGHQLATTILMHSYKYIHLIGHSAGARLIQQAANDLIASNKIRQENPFIHLTFLDAYQPNNDDYGNLEGYHKHYSEHYVDRTLSIYAPWTNSCLTHAFNFDITNWPSDNPVVEKRDFGHQWPRYWYEKSIITPGFGFALSFEGGNGLFDTMAEDFPQGRQCSLLDEGSGCEQADCW